MGLFGVGIALEQDRWYARLALSGLVSSDELRSAAFETRLRIGPRFTRPLAFGMLIGYRVASQKAFGPWLEQLVFAGIEGTQCPFPDWNHVSLCLYESVAAGPALRRAEYDRSGALRVLDQQTSSISLLASLGMLVRYSL